jgi:signal transduction histidine kinase/ligand-binding sensor domain-containing protein
MNCVCFREIRVALVLLVFSAVMPGTPPSREYLHSQWRQVDGIPLTASALAQTRDGLLWLASPQGLIRFDGHFFRQGPQLRRGMRVAVLLGSKSEEALWIGTSQGLGRLKGQHLQYFTTSEGMPEGRVNAILEDRNGVIWVGSSGAASSGIAVIRPGASKPERFNVRLPAASVLALHQDRAGTYWVGTSAGLCRFGEGTAALTASSCELVAPGEILSLAEDERGGLLILNSGLGLQKWSGGTLTTLIRKNLLPVPYRMIRDRTGTVWIGTLGQGLMRLDPNASEPVRQATLTNDAVATLAQDTEGAIWVGTAGGLDRLALSKAHRWSTADGLSGNLATSILGTADGSVWLGTSGGGVNWIRSGQAARRALPSVERTTVMSLLEDRDRTIWLGTTRGLFTYSGGALSEVKLSASTLDRVFQLAQDTQGSVWAVDSKAGLLVAARGAPIRAYDTKPSEPIYSLLARSNGELWLGHFSGGITVRKPRGETVVHRPLPDGGAIQSIHETGPDTVWIGSEGGLARFERGTWTAWKTGRDLPAGGLHNLLSDRKSLWALSLAGLVRFDPASATGSAIAFSVYGLADGIETPRARGLVHPRLTQSTDGSLWISTEAGVLNVRPEELENYVPPKPFIDKVTVDGLVVAAGPDSLFRFRGRALAIEYTAPSLATRLGLGFRYRLDGVDRDWVDAGNSRRIVYSDLAAGRYRFAVQSYIDGRAKPSELVQLSFYNEPHFYQTWLFASLVAAAVAAMIYAVHRLRLRQIDRHFRVVMQERMRVTRELHDTVLQGFAAVVYKLEGASRHAEKRPELSQQLVAQALDLADHSLAEGRRALMFLRLPALESQSLPDALDGLGRELARPASVRFHFTMNGEQRQLRYDVEGMLYLIAKEALGNAVAHARASQITIVLEYSGSEVRLTVTDDGVGFDADALPERKDHLGMASMRERAEAVGGRLSLTSQPGKGVTVMVALPVSAKIDS